MAGDPRDRKETPEGDRRLSGQAGDLGADPRCWGQAGDATGRQKSQAQSRRPQGRAGTGRDPSSGPHSRRRSVTCSRPALGMGMPPCSSVGTRGVSWAGPWVGVPAGCSGTSGSLPSSATSASSASVRAAPPGAPPHSRGARLRGRGQQDPWEDRGDGQSCPRPSCRKLAAPTPRPAPPSPRSPFVSARQSAACAGARTRADCAGTIAGKSRWDKAAVAHGHGHGTGHGTRWWYSPWLWHTVGAQPCLGAERALRVGGGPVCPGQHRRTWHPVGAGALAPRATTEPCHQCVTG